MIEFARQFSFLIFSIGCFGIFVFFLHKFLSHRRVSNLINSLGFGLLGISSAINLFQHRYTEASYFFATIAYLALFIGIVIDSHSKFKLTFPVPLIAIYFLTEHQLLYSLAFLVVIVYLYLSYKLTHSRLIPLIGAFILVTAGEYLYSLKGSYSYPGISDAGIFLYIGASLIFMGWILFYLMRKVVNLFKPSS